MTLTVRKSAAEAHAIWLRLHNDAPLPIKIPTHTTYRLNPQCFYSYADDQKLLGLCNDMEVSIWFRLEDIEGETFHGIPFIPTAILLPKTSVLFPIPKEALSGNGSIQFNYVFQNEMDGNDLDDYGTEITLKFRASDLPQATKQ